VKLLLRVFSSRNTRFSLRRLEVIAFDDKFS